MSSRYFLGIYCSLFLLSLNGGKNLIPLSSWLSIKWYWLILFINIQDNIHILKQISKFYNIYYLLMMSKYSTIFIITPHLIVVKQISVLKYNNLTAQCHFFFLLRQKEIFIFLAKLLDATWFTWIKKGVYLYVCNYFPTFSFSITDSVRNLSIIFCTDFLGKHNSKNKNK